MPRKPRFFLPGYATHVIQRGNNRQPIFWEDGDYRCYLSILGQAREKYGCAIHAYVLMSNHAHLLVTPAEKTSISRMMQYVGRLFVPYINKKYGRTGTLWEGRFKASIVDNTKYALACYRYIELNPVRAGMVQKSLDYRWSSHLHNAYGVDNELLTPHRAYSSLGVSLDQRTMSYRSLFNQTCEEAELSLIRNYVQSGTPLGEGRFCAEVKSLLSRDLGLPGRGRPQKCRDMEKGL